MTDMEEDIRNFVYQTFCRDHGLLENKFATKETVLKRNGDVCGVMYCLYGPRAVKFTAIWEQHSNRIFFYGANGKRYREENADHLEPPTAAVRITK